MKRRFQKRIDRLNRSSVVSNLGDSEIKSPSRQRRKKEKACNVEETPTNNAASSKCVTWNSLQAPLQLEEIVEPNCKKKKWENKKAEIACPEISTISQKDHSKTKLPSSESKNNKIACTIEGFPTNNVASSEYVTWNSSQLLCQLQIIDEPTHKKKDETMYPEISNFVIIMLEMLLKKIQLGTSSENALKRFYEHIVVRSASLSGVELQVNSRCLGKKGWESVLLLNGRKITSSLAENQKLSKKNIYRLAYPILIKKHYQIVITDKTCVSPERFMAQQEDTRLPRENFTLTATVTKEAMEGKANETLESPSDYAFEILLKGVHAVARPFKSTAAMKMMKTMGWTEGTGLGPQNQGIVEPITTKVVDGRNGFGSLPSVNTESFVQLTSRYLTNYKNNTSLYDIVFSNEFSSDERKLIHHVASEMGLCSTSIGEGPNRKLIVRRSSLPIIELLKRLIESKGSDPLFSRINLIPPTGKLIIDQREKIYRFLQRIVSTFKQIDAVVSPEMEFTAE